MNDNHDLRVKPWEYALCAVLFGLLIGLVSLAIMCIEAVPS
jgi:hypothetical protein